MTKFFEMKIIILVLILIAGVSCSKTDPQPVAPKYTSLIGSWKYDGNGILFKDNVATLDSAHVTITFAIFTDSLHPKNDTLYIRHGAVTYNGKSSSQLYNAYDSLGYPKFYSRLKKNVDGTYNIWFSTEIPILYNGSPSYTGNGTYFGSCTVNSSFTQMIGLSSNTIHYISASWCSVAGFDGTTADKVLNFTSPAIIKRTK